MARVSANAVASSSTSPVIPATASTSAPLPGAVKTRKPKSTSSKLRMHKGNTPVLPQTKQCTLCNAKFTRTTHLTRHLRSHSNERLYSCDLCNAEFTRSDLLTRHQRSCGDPNAGRSRRTSCESCAKSKIKCDLEQPCSKCSSRGRECVYLNDPHASKEKQHKQAALRTPHTPDDHPAPSPASSTSLTPDLGTLSPPDDLALPGLVEDTGSVSPPSFQASLSPQPEPQVDINAHENLEIIDPIAAAVGYDFDGTYLQDASQVVTCPHAQYPEATNIDYHQVDFSLAQFNELIANNNTPILPSLPTAFPEHYQQQQHELTVFGSMLPTSPLTSNIPSPGAYNAPPQEDVYGAIWTPVETNTQPDPCLTTCQEKNRYFGLFFTAYLDNYPFIHQATWTASGKPWILLKAMQACGAMYASDDHGGTRFVRDTLGFMKDILVWEFSRINDPMERDNIIVATGLLLTICAFDQVHDEFFRTYHETLVNMIREAGVVERVSKGWDAMMLAVRDIQHGRSEELDKMWIAWSHYETMKRVLLLAYISDCSLPPSFHPSEFSINMACEASLFAAPSAVAWYDTILRAPLSGPKANGPGGLGANVQMTVRMLNLEGTPGSVPGVPGDTDILENVKEMSPCSRGVIARTVQILVWVGQAGMMPQPHSSNSSSSSSSSRAMDIWELENMFNGATGRDITEGLVY